MERKTLQEYYQRIQTLAFFYQQKQWPTEKIGLTKSKAWTEIVFAAQKLDPSLDPKTKDFLPKLISAINLFLTGKKEILETAELDTFKIRELVEDYDRHLASFRSQEQARLTPDYLTQFKIFQTKIGEISEKQSPEIKAILESNPRLKNVFIEAIATDVVENLPPALRLTEEDYQETLGSAQPEIQKHCQQLNINQPETVAKTLVKFTAQETLKEAQTVALTPPTPKWQPARERPLKKVEKEKRGPWIEPTTRDLTYLNWRPSGGRVSPIKKTTAAAKKIISSPVAKPIQWLVDLAPEEVREKNKTLTFLAKGYTPRAVDQTLQYLYQNEPQSPEIPLWQALKALYQTEKTPFQNTFERYYEWNFTGKRITKVESVSSSRVAKFVTFGKFENFSSLRTSFWQVFKGSRIGGWISQTSGKLLLRLGKFASAFSGIGTALLASDTFKKGLKAAGAYLLGLLMIAAHYGPAAVLGTFAGGIGGGIIGGFLGFKIGGLIGVAIGGPLGMAIGGTIGFFAGLITQFIWDHLTSGAASLPQSATAGMTQATSTATATASLAIPAATATAVAGGLIVSQIISSAFFIPSEKEYLTSPYIQVTKAVEFSGNLGDPINYTLQVTAVDRNLTQVRIVDQPTATCTGTPPTINEQSWNSDLALAAGETWQQTYSVMTDDQFNNCLISNTARVTALADGEPAESFSTGHVSIGQPPEVIPWGLPIHDNPQRGIGYTYNQITEEGTVHQGIDVHGPPGATVYSTFTAESKITSVGYGTRSGYYIILSAGQYQIFMGHLAQEPNLKINDTVGPQAPVGIQGDTGHAIGEHVHYMIWENGIIVDPRQFGVPSPPW
jgi:murein DD-endopeptidase MepM/ murein hydrolase activator NlpD